jgi:hypothetical protein
MSGLWRGLLQPKYARTQCSLGQSSNSRTTGESELARVMPAASVEYRYPLIAVELWDMQTIQPIAQFVLRPNDSAQ